MAKVIVITGGIGSGKSEVCRILACQGYTTQYDADSSVKRLYAESPVLVPELESALGLSLRDDAGVFRPALLAGKIFSDKSALETVEKIVFPALLEDFKNFSEASDSEYIIFESATILEKDFFTEFGDAVLFVRAPFEVRLRRAIQRDHSTEVAVRARMNNQKMMNAFSESSPFILDESWNLTYRRIDAFVDTDCPFDQMELRVQKAINLIKTKMFLP